MTAADPTSDDYYSVLGVARDATEQDISKAYKKAAIRWHPDKNPGDPKAEEAFKRVAEAYDCLSKSDKRAAYDRFGKDALKSGMNGGGGSFDHAQAEEIFKTFFGGQDPFDVLLKGGGMPGGFGMHFASMNSGGMGGGRGGCGPNGGPRMMFSSMGGMPGGMGGMGFGPEMMFGGMPGGMGGGGGGCGGMGGRGMGGRSVRPKRSVGFNELAPNTLVSISGLRSAAHQNGKHARVLSYDPEKQRYTVRLLEGDDDGGGGASGEQLAVRVDNLHAVVDVELTDVSSMPALNGTTGRLLSYDSDSGRYHVRLHDGRIAALAPTSVIVPAGTCCTVTGLASASAQQHNGARAKVVGYDRASGRYEVAVSPSSHLKLKRENVRV